MSYCPKCGKSLRATDIFCPRCGAKIIKVPESNTASDRTSSYSSNRADDVVDMSIAPESKRFSNIVRRVQWAGALVLASIALLFYLEGATNTDYLAPLVVSVFISIALFFSQTCERKRFEAMEGYIAGDEDSEREFLINGSFTMVADLFGLIILIVLHNNATDYSLRVLLMTGIVTCAICAAMVIASHVVFSRENGMKLMTLETAKALGGIFVVLALLAGVLFLAFALGSNKSEDDSDSEADSSSDEHS